MRGLTSDHSVATVIYGAATFPTASSSTQFALG